MVIFRKMGKTILYNEKCGGFMKKTLSVRTDLAIEALNMNKNKKLKNIIDKEEVFDNVIVKETILNKEEAEIIGKRAGVYYLLDISKCDINDTDELNNIEQVLTRVLKEVLKYEKITIKSKGLVVGLGNSDVTPDALGPLVIDDVIVTRHMFLLNPDDVSEGISNVSAIAPGVMGNTGIETSDIIQAIIEKIDIDYIIVVDALASSSLARVNKSIQVTNTGISPGSGVGNRRKELSKEVIGVPVIAIGVPTVVDAVTIAANTLDYIVEYLNKELKKTTADDKLKEQWLGTVGTLSSKDKMDLFSTVLTENGINMMVTPKEVDIDIKNLSEIISGAIDRALHTIVN